MNFYQTFSSRLKEARKKSGLSQKELADKVQVSQGTISAYEKGTGDKGSGPTIEKVAKIAAALDVSLDWLCGLDKQKPASVEIDPAAWLSYLFRLLDSPRNFYYSVFEPDPDPYSESNTIERKESTPLIELNLLAKDPVDAYSADDLGKAKPVAAINLYGDAMFALFRAYNLVSQMRDGSNDEICDSFLQGPINRYAPLLKPLDDFELDEGDLPF